MPYHTRSEKLSKLDVTLDEIEQACAGNENDLKIMKLIFSGLSSAQIVKTFPNFWGGRGVVVYAFKKCMAAIIKNRKQKEKK